MSTLKRLAENAVVVDKDYFNEHAQGARSAYIAGPVSDLLIEAAESELGITFPGEYRSFLSRYGAMVADGLELSGITPYEADGPPFFLDVVAATKAADQLPGEMYVVLSYDGMGVTFMLDTTASGQIKVIARGPGLDDLEVASSLDELLDGMLKDTFAARLNAASATVR